jgi:hypothetical protein
MPMSTMSAFPACVTPRVSAYATASVDGIRSDASWDSTSTLAVAEENLKKQSRLGAFASHFFTKAAPEQPSSAPRAGKDFEAAFGTLQASQGFGGMCMPTSVKTAT